MTDDARRLLGGYATGTLTETEKKALFEAALSDQDLFEKLAQEDALRELMDDPAARAELLRAVETPRFSMRTAFVEWLERPRSKALLATATVLVIAISISVVRQRPPTEDVAHLRLPVIQAPIIEPPKTAMPEEHKRRNPSAPQAKQGPPSTPARAISVPKPSTARPVEMHEPGSFQPKVEGVLAGTPPAAASIALRKEEVAEHDRFLKIITAGDLTLRYKLLKRDQSGTFQPIVPETELKEGDAIRLIISSNQRGALGIGTASSRMVTSLIQPEQDTTLPSSDSLLVDSGTASITLSFAKFDPRSDALPSSLFVPRVQRDARVASSQTVPRQKLQEANSAPVPPGPAPVQFEIKLNVKKP